MKKLPWIIAAFFFCTSAAMAYMFILKGNVKTAEDGRQAILLSQENKDFVLQEMRQFLSSVQQITEGAIEGDMDKIITAANISGGTVIEHTPPSLMRSMPIAFKKLGFDTHYKFDKIAEDAKTGIGKEHTLKQLNVMLSNCVACHSAYKIELIKK